MAELLLGSLVDDGVATTGQAESPRAQHITTHRRTSHLVDFILKSQWNLKTHTASC